MGVAGRVPDRCIDLRLRKARRTKQQSQQGLRSGLGARPEQIECAPGVSCAATAKRREAFAEFVTRRERPEGKTIIQLQNVRIQNEVIADRDQVGRTEDGRELKPGRCRIRHGKPANPYRRLSSSELVTDNARTLRRAHRRDAVDMNSL